MFLRHLVSVHIQREGDSRYNILPSPPSFFDAFELRFDHIIQPFKLEPAYCESISQASVTPDQIETENFQELIRTKKIAEIELIIKNGFDLKRRDGESWASIHWATEMGDERLVVLFLDKDPLLLNMKTKEGLSPINIAAWQGNKKMVDLLLKQGAEVDDRTKWGEVPLHHAVTFDHVAVCEVLLVAGADPFAEDKLKRSPFMLAMQKGSPKMKKLFSKFAPKE